MAEFYTMWDVKAWGLSDYGFGDPTDFDQPNLSPLFGFLDRCILRIPYWNV